MCKGLHLWMQIFLGLGLEFVKQWLKTAIVGCLQKKIVDCQKGDFLKDPVLTSTFLYL